jgi:NADH-quinone oxidoreductase subunit H
VTILQFFLWSLLKVAVVTVVMLLGVAYTVLLERKLVGRIQNRWGPSRVGPLRPACSRWSTARSPSSRKT